MKTIILNLISSNNIYIYFLNNYSYYENTLSYYIYKYLYNFHCNKDIDILLKYLLNEHSESILKIIILNIKYIVY